MFSLLSLIFKPRAALGVSANDAKRIILRFHLPSVSLVQRSQAYQPATKENHFLLEPWEQRIIFLLMSFYFNLTLGKMDFNSPKSVGQVWIKYTMTAILLKEIIEKPFLLGASIAHYILATSVRLKLSLINFFF